MTQKQKSRLRAARLAQDLFGYEQLRPGQEAALHDLLEGNDTLAVMPTGSGKSMIYQAAGSVLPGPTIIISPLIALQRDQVASIEEQGIGKAAMVNWTMKNSEIQKAFEDLKESKLDFLFLAPEQFGNEETLQRLKEAKPSLFVVDEAHCISDWGHDFRPDYLRLGTMIEELDHPRVLALTATASLPVREEILERLHMRDPRIVVQGFDRPNIWLGVEMFQDEDEKKKALLERVVETEKPGIIYTATHKHAEEVAEALLKQGVKASFYHAGMKAKERHQVEEAFMNDEVEVIVATSAFGMGIDKPNVRFVFLYDICDSVDLFYQEIGRAGRDGEPAKAILFYCSKDLNLQRFLASSGRINTDQVERVAKEIQEHEGPIEPEELHEEIGISQTKVEQVLTNLEELDVVKSLPNGTVVNTEQPVDVDEIAEEAVQMHEDHRQLEKSRIEMMRGYVEVLDCRREYLLNYFGEPFKGPCDYCDNCDAGITFEENDSEMPFPLNSRVRHKAWGEGLVMRYEGDKIVVMFDTVGYKTLSVEIVTENGLLQQVT